MESKENDGTAKTSHKRYLFDTEKRKSDHKCWRSIPDETSRSKEDRQTVMGVGANGENQMKKKENLSTSQRRAKKV